VTLSLFTVLLANIHLKVQDRKSFRSGKGMRALIDMLPKPRMLWKSVEVIPRSGATSSPVFLCYRDPVEAIRSLLDRPSLRDHLMYAPQRHWTASGSRQYTEIMTGDWAWQVQVCIQLKNSELCFDMITRKRFLLALLFSPYFLVQTRLT